MREHKTMVRQKTLENLELFKLIKILGYEEREKERVGSLHAKWSDLIRKYYITSNMFRNFPRVLDALAPALVFLVGGWKVFTNEMTIGDLVIVTGYLPAINAPIRSFSTTFLAIKDIDNRLERVTDIIDFPKNTNIKEEAKYHAVKGEIKFHNVTVEKERGIILNNVSFSIKKGEHVALVGVSGSGKSSILKLITKLYEPTKGNIYLDGKLISDLPTSSIKQQIGFVSQDTFLFNDSLYKNLTYIKESNLDQMKTILKELDLEELYKRDGGFEIIVGEKGLSLSGGQRQRVGIARALLSNPNVLLLDEATSALDPESEKKVTEIIQQKFRHKTTISVAHRLETVVQADKILVFKAGNLVESGRHDDLLEYDGEYKKLWDSREINSKGGELHVSTT
ncbi:ABC transporter ATP-binding protein [Bacillus cereus]|nr:ABC transporter ATP-binding protein [Bacillus cereus]